ncbi:MAG: alpha/beta fold hydrolase [Acidimicrobiales bacterium]
MVLIATLHCIDLIWEEPGVVHALERLARLGRVVVIDYRGFGSADPVPLGGLPTLEIWMEDTRVVLDSIGSERAHIICHGGSGFIGMLFAAMHPKRTETLTLIEATAQIAQADDYPIGVSDDDLEVFIDEDVRRWGTESHVELWAPSRAGDPRFHGWLARFERGAMSNATHVATFRWVAGADLRAVLPTIRVPTLVINRERDFMNPKASARFLAEHIERATLVIVPGTDYWFCAEEIDAIFDKVEEFVTGAPAIEIADRALAAVMFTDIVGSTSHATRLGDGQWAQVLDRHDSIVARETRTVPGSKSEPDGRRLAGHLRRAGSGNQVCNGDFRSRSRSGHRGAGRTACR